MNSANISTNPLTSQSSNNLNTQHNIHHSYYQPQMRYKSSTPNRVELKPYPKTDFSFLNANTTVNKIDQPKQSRVEPNIYGTKNVNYLLKMKKISVNDVSQQNQAPQGSPLLTSRLTNSCQSMANQEIKRKPQTEREKFFAEYIKNNGDAATMIIPNFLYIGGHRSVNNVANLVKDKITHVLNMAGELHLDWNEMEKNNIKLLNMLAKDSKVYNIRKDFDQTFQFIDGCLKSKGKIIVNCARGISRSGTIVIAYLMFRYSMSLMEAYNFTTSQRTQVRPNSYFRKQLELYEHELAYNRFKMQFKNKTQNQNLASSQQSSTLSMAGTQIKM